MGEELGAFGVGFVAEGHFPQRPRVAVHVARRLVVRRVGQGSQQLVEFGVREARTEEGVLLAGEFELGGEGGVVVAAEVGSPVVDGDDLPGFRLVAFVVPDSDVGPAECLRGGERRVAEEGFAGFGPAEDGAVLAVDGQGVGDGGLVAFVGVIAERMNLADWDSQVSKLWTDMRLDGDSRMVRCTAPERP